MKERLIKFLAHLRIGQVKFEENVGLSRGFVNTLKGNLTIKTLRKIETAYPELNTNWLINGEGDMLKTNHQSNEVNNNKGIVGIQGNRNTIKNITSELKSGSKSTDDPYSINEKGKGVPYYDVDFLGGFDIMENDQTIKPAHYIDFPQYAKADYWVNVTGHSMEPLINHGDMIAMRTLNDWKTYMLFGEVYGIVTDEYRTIKYVKKSSKGEDYFLLKPENGDYDEQDIPISIIRNVFQVLGSAKKIF